jgi:hypothetical protein
MTDKRLPGLEIIVRRGETTAHLTVEAQETTDLYSDEFIKLAKSRLRDAIRAVLGFDRPELWDE